MKSTLLIFVVLFFVEIKSYCQKKKVLFLGNSYTAVNNLPQVVADVAASVNDTLVFDSHTVGGQTLLGHSQDPASLNKIKLGTWDYVVLQAQSQEPSLPTTTVLANVFPYARFLDSVSDKHNTCAQTMFFMTWGRKNGDAMNCSAYPNWQYVCTYKGMDSLLNLRYRMMADSNKAIVSPVGEVWNYIRTNYPLIELYSGDESHPSEAGTYAAACCFYTSIFRKNPSFTTFNSTLPAADAANIRTAVRLVVFNNLLKWNIGKYDHLLSASCLASGIKELSQHMNLRVYPNPATNNLTVTNDLSVKELDIVIYDCRGIAVIHRPINSGAIIDVSSLPVGMYFIRAGSYLTKFLKE